MMHVIYINDAKWNIDFAILKFGCRLDVIWYTSGNHIFNLKTIYLSHNTHILMIIYSLWIMRFMTISMKDKIIFNIGQFTTHSVILGRAVIVMWYHSCDRGSNPSRGKSHTIHYALNDMQLL